MDLTQAIIPKIKDLATKEEFYVSFSHEEKQAFKDLYLVICAKHGMQDRAVRFNCSNCIRKRSAEMYPYLAEFEKTTTKAKPKPVPTKKSK